MKRIVIALGLLVGLAVPTSASASARVAVPPLPREFEVHFAPCPDQTEAFGITPGCAYDNPADPRFGNVYIDASAEQTRRSNARFTKLHELGHIFLAEHLTARDEAMLAQDFGLSLPWDQGTGAVGGDNSPKEFAADAYAACRMHLNPGDAHGGNWITSYGWQPPSRMFRRVCATLAAAAGTNR